MLGTRKIPNIKSDKIKELTGIAGSVQDNVSELGKTCDRVITKRAYEDSRQK